MHELVEWFGFLGSWLLVAGPIYQAALELQEQDVAFDRIRSAGERVSMPPEVSAWWWLLPPVRLLLERRRERLVRHTYFAVLESEDQAALVVLMNKATAWVMVAAGGMLLATAETWSLVEHLDRAVALCWLLVVLLVAASLMFTVIRLKRSDHVLARRAAAEQN